MFLEILNKYMVSWMSALSTPRSEAFLLQCRVRWVARTTTVSSEPSIDFVYERHGKIEYPYYGCLGHVTSIAVPDTFDFHAEF